MRRSPELILLPLLLLGCPANTPPQGGKVDVDGDGFGLAVDCNDANPLIHPEADEVCDSVDNDCDGATDEADAVDAPTWYADIDGDGYGADAYPRVQCDQPRWHSAVAGDCNDQDDRFHPDATERCDEVDNDCDGEIDEEATDAKVFYVDVDGDGFGLSTETIDACELPDGYALFGGDCDDTDKHINPDAEETWYDGVDGNCDDRSDFDQDGDGYDDADHGGSDCVDDDATISPAATETCDEIDNDCDGEIDEADATGTRQFWIDADGDGQGDVGVMVRACSPPEGYVANRQDCDDTDPAIFLGATEIWYDGVDQDCDGLSDYDQDGDGYDAEEFGGGDCNDLDASVLPTTWYPDSDGDGFGDDSSTTFSCEEPADHVLVDGDCDDDDAAVNPDAEEVCGNGVDDDCDGSAGGCSIEGETDFDAGVAWLAGAGGDDRAGLSLAHGGDIDGDGVHDLIIGAPQDKGPSTDAGFVHIVLGPITGDLSLADVPTIAGVTGGDLFGFRVAGNFDADGDGFDDVFVGASLNDDAATEAGAAYLLLGPVSADISATDSDGIWRGSAASDYAGYAVGHAGDLDGDGLDDLAVGAPYSDSGATNGGVTYLLYGPATGSSSLASADLVLTGTESNGQSGVAAKGVGDVDGDGFDDFAVGSRRGSGSATSSGAVYIFTGPLTSDHDLADAPIIIPGEVALDQFGASLAGGVDLDGDGTSEVLVGAPANDRGGLSSGAAWLFYGPLSGTVSTSAGADVTILEGGSAGDRAGTSVDLGGDYDGDGSPDLWLGSTSYSSSSGTSQVGAAFLFLGPPTGTLTTDDAEAWIQGGTKGDAAGQSVIYGGDLQDDGTDDVVVGLPGVSGSVGAEGGAALHSSGEGL